MTRITGWLIAVSAVAGMCVTGMASATVGYFALGYGPKAMGLAGAVVSNPQDTATIAVNPAGMTAVGERVDVGLRFFNPNREAVLNTTAVGGTFDVADESRRDLFLIPNIGFNLKVRDNLWFGFNNYGNGGLNATYDRNIYDEAFAVLGAAAQGISGVCDPLSPPPGVSSCAQLVPEGATTGLPNTGTLGVDLAQAIFAPTLAMKINDKNSLGASLLIGVQRFSARGLGNFQCFTNSVATNPANAATCPQGFAAVPSTKLTGNNSDWSFGAGVRVGWLGEVHPNVTLGASVSSKVYMSEFDDYAELFAEQGDLDIPANFTLGATFQATPKLKVSLDYQRILYEGVNSISNAGPVFLAGAGPVPPTLPLEGPASPNNEWLGKDNGMGFGWEDINIYRLAAEYDHNEQWTFRAGLSLNDQTIPDSQVLFNILAPAVIERHATFGFTYMPDKRSEWSFAYMRAFSEDVKTSQTAFGIPGAIEMDQNSVDVGYSYKF